MQVCNIRSHTHNIIVSEVLNKQLYDCALSQGWYTCIYTCTMYIVCIIIAQCSRSTIADVSLASQPYFSAYAHARAKVGGGREGKILSTLLYFSAYAHASAKVGGGREGKYMRTRMRIRGKIRLVRKTKQI